MHLSLNCALFRCRFVRLRSMSSNITATTRRHRAPNEDRHIGVAIASIPKARHLNDGFTLELNRVCCDPAFFNACSKLYGAAVKVGKAMGYTRFITYTLPEECGSSVKAVGFRLDGTVPERKDGWRRNNHSRNSPCRIPAGPKLRWVLDTRPIQDHGNCDE